jgi:glyoxylase-like metal-dependent hydrolase (beta-lactamase superfamily II)
MQLAPGIHAIQQRQGIRVQAYLLDDGDGLTLIDTLYGDEAELILSEIAAMGKTPQDLRRILLTHAHRAHLGGLARLKALTSAPVYCHPWEADIVAGERRQQCMSLRPQKPFVVWPFQVASRFGRYRPCPVDRLLGDEEPIGPVRVVATPGHTPGHVSFHWPERRALFAGDTVVTWPELEPGWSGFTLNARQNWDSFKKLAALDVDIVGGGHGDAIASDGARRLREVVAARGG